MTYKTYIFLISSFSVAAISGISYGIYRAVVPYENSDKVADESPEIPDINEPPSTQPTQKPTESLKIEEKLTTQKPIKSPVSLPEIKEKSVSQNNTEIFKQTNNFLSSVAKNVPKEGLSSGGILGMASLIFSQAIYEANNIKTQYFITNLHNYVALRGYDFGHCVLKNGWTSYEFDCEIHELPDDLQREYIHLRPKSTDNEELWKKIDKVNNKTTSTTGQQLRHKNVSKFYKFVFTSKEKSGQTADFSQVNMFQNVKNIFPPVPTISIQLRNDNRFCFRNTYTDEGPKSYCSSDKQ